VKRKYNALGSTFQRYATLSSQARLEARFACTPLVGISPLFLSGSCSDFISLVHRLPPFPFSFFFHAKHPATPSLLYTQGNPLSLLHSPITRLFYVHRVGLLILKRLVPVTSGPTESSRPNHDTHCSLRLILLCLSLSLTYYCSLSIPHYLLSLASSSTLPYSLLSTIPFFLSLVVCLSDNIQTLVSHPPPTCALSVTCW
jgi:hypothetical protein